MLEDVEEEQSEADLDRVQGEYKQVLEAQATITEREQGERDAE